MTPSPAARYQEQVHCNEEAIDPEFWANPHGIEVPRDSLKFLYIPDHVSTYIAAQVARKVYRYQIDNICTQEQITHAVMIYHGRPAARRDAPRSPGLDAQQEHPTD